MAQARSAATLPSARVQVIAPRHLGDTAIAALRARGIDARISDAPGEDIVAWAIETPPTPTATIELARACASAAAAGRPVCLLVPPPRGKGRAAVERAAALAYLRAHGAALGHDVDAWLEAVVALVRFGMPQGPHTAVIAPAGSWLEAQALVIVAEAESNGARPPHIDHNASRGEGGAREEPTDVVLYEPSLGPPPGNLAGLHIPVIARPELGSDDHAALYGARASLAAIAMLGRAAERIAVGLGPASPAATSELAINRELLDKQLAKLGHGRVGDHETKVLLKAFGAPITRQKVAITPSAAVKVAREVRFPVEIKPWGADLPTEPAGCPVEREITSDALVRRAFAHVLAAAGRLPSKVDAGAVIVRETPPAGRELAVSFVKLPAVGWTVVLDGPQIAAAPAPLRLVDAHGLASAVVASRAGDPEPDRAGLANLLRRVSHLVVDLGDRLSRFELPRVIVGSRGSRSVIVDAWCELT